MLYKDKIYSDHIKIIKYNNMINHIINNSEIGRFKNICSGNENCKNITRYKYLNQATKNYNYFCTDCLKLKELPI